MSCIKWLSDSTAQVLIFETILLDAVTVPKDLIWYARCVRWRLLQHQSSTYFPVTAFIRHVDYFRVARKPSRVDGKRGDHFLQTDFSVLISLWLRQIYFRLADKLPKRWVRL